MTFPSAHRTGWLAHLRLAGAICIVCGQLSAVWGAPPRGLTLPSNIAELKTLSQNWSHDEAEWFYAVPQGSHLVPYRWFLFLEQADSDKPFRDPEHIWSLGYLPRKPDHERNPDGLPVGFVKDGDQLGLSCAACHTGLLKYQDRAWLIDGAPTLGDIEALLRRLADALDQTFQDNAKFDRFARGVLGGGASAPDRAALKAHLREVRDVRRGYNDRNMPAAGSASFGPGRVDAIGAIMNEVATTFARVPSNAAAADAPVSYPFLWDTPQHDYVQWNGSAPNVDLLLAKATLGTVHAGALSRNAGEVLGVFGEVDASREGSLLQLRGYSSSVNKPNLVEIEESLRKLWSPKWPDEFPAIDEPMRSAGAQLFEQNCRECHQPIQRDSLNRTVQAKMRAVGTDQAMASNFALRRSKTGILENRKFLIAGIRTLKAEEPTKDLLVHMVLRVVTWPSNEPHLFHATPDEMLVQFPLSLNFPVYAEVQVGDRKIMGAFDGLKVADGKVQQIWSRNALLLTEAAKLYRQDLSGFDTAGQFLTDAGERFSLDQWSAVRHEFTPAGTQLSFSEPAEIHFAYKARPLNGIWAAAPYLHNGSVPNLDELLKPAHERIKKFRVGSREFDPAVVGFRIDAGAGEFDAAVSGNSNAGHEYKRTFSEIERKQLIEYMKSL